MVKKHNCDHRDDWGFLLNRNTKGLDFRLLLLQSKCMVVGKYKKFSFCFNDGIISEAIKWLLAQSQFPMLNDENIFLVQDYLSGWLVWILSLYFSLSHRVIYKFDL